MSDSEVKGESLDEDAIEWEIINDGRHNRRRKPLDARTKKMLEKGKERAIIKEQNKDKISELMERINGGYHKRLLAMSPEEKILHLNLDALFDGTWEESRTRKGQK